MTRNEWLELAKEWDTKADEARSRNKEQWAEHCERKASACRTTADYAPEGDQ